MSVNARKPVRISVTMTVEVDPDTWELEYGNDPSGPSAFRQAVRDYVVNQVQGSAASESGAITAVTTGRKTP